MDADPAFPPAKAILCSLEEDRGLVERPMLAPHLDFRLHDDTTALIVSEAFSGVLHGRRYIDLLPLLDGRRSRREIAAALADRHSAVAVQTALVSLASKGYVVSAGTAISRERAAFWSACGASPRWAETRLGAARVAVTGDGLGAPLAAMGVTVTDDDPTLSVLVCDDLLGEDCAETNRRHLASARPWLPVAPGTLTALFGPVFRPGDAGPCWACLAHRLRSNREIDTFLRIGGGGAVLRRIAPAPLVASILGLVALEIAKWIVFGERAALQEHVLSVDAYSLASDRHRVFRRPQCGICGDPALWRPDRAPVPVILRSCPRTVANSGGSRSVAPRETIARYRHLVSPVSGVVTQLMRSTSETDPWLHVYWSGSNIALRSDNLRLLRTTLRSKSSGKGASPEQAEASALCEAIERVSGAFHGDEIRRRARLEDFADGEAIHPNEIQLFSDRQYDHAEEINARGARFNFVPQRFDPAVEMDWTPVWSMTRERHRYLPTSMLYFAGPLEGGQIYCGPDSNGCASGNTLEEAILQGFFELVERDAFACWWYNRVSLPVLDLDSFGESYFDRAREYYRSFHRDLRMLDATSDLGIPVFVAVSRRTDKEAEDILYSAGAHFEPRIAAFRALCELNQYLVAVRDADADGGGYLYDDPECLWWWHNAKLAEQSYLAPDRRIRRAAQDYSAPNTTDIRDDVEHCRALVEAKGMEFLVLDQTRPDIGMPVARTIVPGLRHFWPRFAPGRLYDVPVAMGWRRTPISEADLNPIAVFI